MTRASVLVTTYRRPDRLAACLDGLAAQSRAPEEVVVVVHAGDEPSARAMQERAARWRVVRCVRVSGHGSVAALNRGLAAARGDIVAIVDDDAVPSPGWLERIVATFAADRRIAAVGGRDIIVVDGCSLAPRRLGRGRRAMSGPEVGRIQWFGRMIGNHHLGQGAPRDVDVLKGANMALRRREILDLGYDERLRGAGAVVHTELAICLPLRRRGRRVVYDPEITVMHYPAPRPHGDDRLEVSRRAVADAAHNEALAILDYLRPWQRAPFILFGVVAGTTDSPGAMVLARDLVFRRPGAWPRFRAAQRGRYAALVTRRIPRSSSLPGADDPPEEGSANGFIRMVTAVHTDSACMPTSEGRPQS